MKKRNRGMQQFTKTACHRYSRRCMNRAVKRNQHHDANAAAYADRVIFLADGHIVDELRSPTSDSVLDYMKKLGA